MSNALVSLACMFGMCGPGSTSFDQLPLDQAIAYKFGNGSRTVAIFSDVDCAPCRTMHREIDKLDDTTVYVFVYPLLSGGQNQALLEHIWCAPDRREALDRAMTGKAVGEASCDAPVKKNLGTGFALGIKSVPAMIAPNGKIKYGGQTSEELARWIAANQKPR